MTQNNTTTNNTTTNTTTQPTLTPTPPTPPTTPITPPTTTPITTTNNNTNPTTITTTTTPTPTPTPTTVTPPSSSFSSSNGSKLGTMTIWLTSECNLKCKYCFVYKLNENQPPGKMTIETADQLIHFAKQYLKSEGTFWFFGAEPFCNYDVMKYIVEKSAKEGHKWRYGATTNATLLTKDIVEWMKKYNFSVLCSIDGPQNSHNENRIYHNGQGSWNEAWQGLTNVKETLKITPQVRWTVTPSTVKGLAENIRSFVEEYNITNMPIDFVHETTWTQQDYNNLQKELETFREYYMKWMEQGIPVFSMWVRDANTAVNNYNNSRAWKSRCGLGTGSVGIDYDGTIYPCHRFIDSHEIKIGNIYTGFNQTQTDFVKNWCKVPPYCEKPKKCLNCNYKKACSGGCIAMNYDILGTVHAIPDTFCTIKQIITNTLGNLCKTLKNNKNKTFNNLYNNKQQQQTTTTKTTTTTATTTTSTTANSNPTNHHNHPH